MPGKRGGITLKELQAKAKQAKVKGWSKMSKAELMQRVGGGGGGVPQRKKGVPITTAQRYETKGVVGKIVSKVGGSLTEGGKKNLEAVLMKRVKSATDRAKKQPGATDQSVRKAAIDAVKSVVKDVRSNSSPKKSRKQSQLEGRLSEERYGRDFFKDLTKKPRSKAKPITPENDEAKRRAMRAYSIEEKSDPLATAIDSSPKPKLSKKAINLIDSINIEKPQRQKKTSTPATGAPQKQKRSPSKKLTGEEKKARLARVSGTVEKMEQRRDRLAQETEKARQSYDHDRYEKLKSRMDTLKQRRRKVKNLQSRLARETAWI